MNQIVILPHSPFSSDSVLPMLCIPHASFSPTYHRLELLLTAELYPVCLCTQLFIRDIYFLPCGQYSNSACRSSVFESYARRFGAALPFKELSRQYTPCAWALVPDAPEVLMIEDLTKDAR